MQFFHYVFLVSSFYWKLNCFVIGYGNFRLPLSKFLSMVIHFNWTSIADTAHYIINWWWRFLCNSTRLCIVFISDHHFWIDSNDTVLLKFIVLFYFLSFYLLQFDKFMLKERKWKTKKKNENHNKITSIKIFASWTRYYFSIFMSIGCFVSW